MTTIRIVPLLRQADDLLPAPATLTATPTFDVQVQDERVVAALARVWDFTERTQPTVTLPPPGVGWAWRLVLRISGQTVASRIVTFAGEAVDWADLTDVDPATLQPTPDDEALAAWIAVQQQLNAVLAGIAVGPQGPAGAQGAQGIPGLQGERGEAGQTGARGPQGVQGDQGERGFTGARGPAGADGAAGAQGVKGDTGARGPAGETGASGAQGPQGERGAVGPAGLTFRGAYDPTIDYLEDDSVAYGGGSWFATNDPPAGAVPSDGSPYWTSMASAGAKGDKGDKGETGATGATGSTGAKGTTGDQGPQGLVGVKGDTGAKGTTGDPGAQGLQGVKGDQGIQGVKGDQGVQGIQGVKGDQGIQGVTGPGVAAGGAAGRFLRKVSATDYATEWAEQGYANTFADASSTAAQNLPTAFTLINLPTENSDAGNNFDPATSLYTVPADGVYSILAKVRLGDGTSSQNGSGINIGIGVAPSSVDGPWFVWNAMPPMGAGYRMVFDYQRTARFTAGQQLRLYGYAQSTVGLTAASLTVIRVA